MKAPKCRLCGKEHWLNEPHAFEVEIRPTEMGTPERQDRSDVVAQNKVDTKQRWSREAYNAYQREYMRKRRKGG